MAYACSSTHALPIAGGNDRTDPCAVSRCKLALDHVGDDLYIAGPVAAEASRRGDLNFVAHEQVAESSVARIVMLVEGKYVMAIEPRGPCVPALTRPSYRHHILAPFLDLLPERPRRLPPGAFGGFVRAAVSAGHAGTPTCTVEHETIAENERAVTVHVRQDFADLRRGSGLLRSSLWHRHEGTLGLCSSRLPTKDSVQGRVPGVPHHAQRMAPFLSIEGVIGTGA